MLDKTRQVLLFRLGMITTSIHATDKQQKNCINSCAANVQIFALTQQ